ERVIATDIRLQVHGTSKSTGSIGGSSDAALNLDASRRRGNVGNIDPKRTERFGVVIGNAVDGNVDTCCVASTNAHARIANARAGVRRGDDRWRPVQQVRKILTEILSTDGRAVDVDKRSWRECVGTGCLNN